MTLILAKNVSVDFHGKRALDDVSMHINEGEIVTVVGPNGAGKSSLVRLLVGAIKASSGLIERAHGLRVGYVPQKLQIDGLMPITVERFLRLQSHRSTQVTNPIRDYTQIDPLLKKQLANLSGGELKRVMLTYALCASPQLLILDEPTAGLDQPAINAFYGLIEQLRNDLKIAVLLVSHDLNVVMRASDRVICLNTHICCEGTPTDVSNAPEFVALFGTNASPIGVYTHHHGHSHDHILHDHEAH